MNVCLSTKNLQESQITAIWFVEVEVMNGKWLLEKRYRHGLVSAPQTLCKSLEKAVDRHIVGNRAFAVQESTYSMS